MKIWVGTGSVHVSLVRKQVGCSPQQLHPTGGLLLLGIIDNSPEIFLEFVIGVTFRGHIDIVEAIILHAHFSDELEGSIHFVVGSGQPVGVGIPWKMLHARPERIGTRAAEGVPVGHGKPEQVFHGNAEDGPAGIVKFKRQRIIRFAAFVGNGC